MSVCVCVCVSSVSEYIIQRIPERLSDGGGSRRLRGSLQVFFVFVFLFFSGESPVRSLNTDQRIRNTMEAGIEATDVC